MNRHHSKILNKFRELSWYYNVTRQIGHTSLLLKGCVNTKNPAYIVSEYKHLASALEHATGNPCIQGISLSELMDTKNYCPIVLDNSILDTLFTEGYQYIEYLEDKLTKLKIENERLKRENLY